MKTSDFYPNKIEKDYRFLKHINSPDRFRDFCLGEEKAWFKDSKNYGISRKNDHLTLKQKLEREYIWREFELWKKWKANGRNIFSFSPQIIKMLNYSDVSTVGLESIKLPFKCFYIDLRAANLFFTKNDSVPVEGLFVYEEEGESYGESDKEAYEKVISLNFTGDYIQNFSNYQGKLTDLSRGFHSYSLFLEKWLNIFTVGDAAKEAVEAFRFLDLLYYLSTEEEETLTELHTNFINNTINLVINCLLYLSLEIGDRDIIEDFPADLPIHLRTKLEKANTKRRKEVAFNEICAAGFTRIKYVGRSLFENKVESDDSLRSASAVSPHWRKGHWRNQKFGTGLMQSKLLWIMPTIVNKDAGKPTHGHIYNVD